MTTSIGVGEIALKWNGTTCDESVANGSATAARSVRDYDFSGCVFDPKLTPFPMRDGAVKDGASTTGEHDGVFWILSELSGISVLERAMLDEWRLLGARYNPYAGVVSLQVDRLDVAGNAVSSVLKVECIEAPCAMFTPKGGGGVRTVGMRASGKLVYPVKFKVAGPFWQAASNTGSQLYAVSASTASHTLNNPGIKPCGGRIAISNVSGTISKFSITNSTTGKVLTIATTASTFTNGDYVDWFYTNINDDPTWSFGGGASAILGGNDGEFELAIGNNTVVTQRVTGTGTCDATITWKRLDFSY